MFAREGQRLALNGPANKAGKGNMGLSGLKEPKAG